MPFQEQSFDYDQHVIKLAKTSVRQAEFESKFKEKLKKVLQKDRFLQGLRVDWGQSKFIMKEWLDITHALLVNTSLGEPANSILC